MTVPTWNHLWFLPYLWLYAVVGALLARMARRAGLRAAPRWPAWSWLLLPALPLVLMRLFVFPRFPSTHGLFDDLYNHLQYGWLFAIGWIGRTPLGADFWPAAQRWRWTSLSLAIAGGGLLIAYFTRYADTPAPTLLLNAQRLLWAAMSWWAILAACGWAQRAFRVESPALRAAGAGVFCAYVLHQSVIVLLTQALKPLALPWGVEALLLIALTAALCVAAYLLLRRLPVVALLVGIQRSSGRVTPRVPSTLHPTSTP